MSCPDGSCFEPMKRKRALILLGLMMLVFMVLSGFSFLDSRNQVTPAGVDYAGENAGDGKRVFQAYNCMGCHTIVGNGAYFAPDLTKEYRDTGPAWLAAFIPSAGTWPTEGAVKAQLLNAAVAEEAGTSSLEEYYTLYPGAKERVERRGGQRTYMPNLSFRSGEVDQLIAFLKYTSAMNTEGWPPAVKVENWQEHIDKLHGKTAATAAVNAGADSAETAASDDPAAHGKKVAEESGCMACHSAGSEKMIGPAWGGIFNREVKLADGTTAKSDEAYLRESILEPNKTIVEGYEPVMPPYGQLLSAEDVDAIISYLKTL